MIAVLGQICAEVSARFRWIVRGENEGLSL